MQDLQLLHDSASPEPSWPLFSSCYFSLLSIHTSNQSCILQENKNRKTFFFTTWRAPNQALWIENLACLIQACGLTWL
jgi:hypothetical protein